MTTKKPKIKAKVTAIVAVFETKTQAEDFFNKYKLRFTLLLSNMNILYTIKCIY